MSSWEDREQRFEEKPVRTAISGTVRTGVVVAVVVAVVLAIGAGVWMLQVATSDVKGTGDAEIIKNDARNRIRAQEGFEAKFAAIVAADKNLNITAEALKAKPGDPKLSIELSGQKMICNDLVAQYNAAARKFTQAEFRDADLPLEINDNTANAATDCKENSK